MYLITLDKVTNMNVLKEFYMNIGRYKLTSIMYINNSIDFKSKNYKIENFISDFITLDLKYLNDILNKDEITIDEIEDCLYDIAELDREIVLKNVASSDFIFNLIKSIGVSYVIPENLLKSNFDNFGDIDTNTELIIYDFFDKKHKFRRFFEEEFSIRLSIDNDGNIWNNNEIKSNILTNGFKALFEFDNYNFKFSTNTSKNKKTNSLIGNYVYDPHFFLIENIDYEREIYNMKKSIFNNIKEVEPNRYKEMKKDILDLFNKNNYIKLTDIQKIIYGNDNVINLLK